MGHTFVTRDQHAVRPFSLTVLLALSSCQLPRAHLMLFSYCPPHAVLAPSSTPSCHPACISCCPPHAALLALLCHPLTLSLPHTVMPSPLYHPSVLLTLSAPCRRLPSAVPSHRHTMLSPSHRSQHSTSRHHLPVKATGQASKCAMHLAYPHLCHVQQMANQHLQATWSFPFPSSLTLP